MLRHRSSISTRTRLVAGCLAGMLAIAACGSSESGDGERDRNVPIAPLALFSQAVDGVARHKLGDASSSITLNLAERQQTDGSHLVAVPAMVTDKAGTRVEVKITRIDEYGVFDAAFGKSGVAVATAGPGILQGVALGTNGHLVVALAPVTSDGKTTRLMRFNAITGTLDNDFGTGGILDIPAAHLSWTNPVVVNDDGSVILIARESNDLNAVRYAERWTNSGRDEAFAVDGRLELPSPTNPDTGTGGNFFCNDPFLAPDGGRLVFLFGCELAKQITDDGGTSNGFSWRILISRTFDNQGLGGTDVVTPLEPLTVLSSGYRSIWIHDVELGRGNNLDKRYVIVETPNGPGRLTFSADYGTYFSTDNPHGEPLGGEVFSVEDAWPRRLSYLNYMNGDSLKVVGVGTTRSDGSTNVEIAEVMVGGSNMFITGRMRIGDFPYVNRSPHTANYVNNDVFINFRGIARSGGSDQDGPIGNNAGYLKIGADGALVEPYGSADGMNNSPVDGRRSLDGTMTQPVLFPADDGTFHSVKLRWGVLEADDVTIASQVVVTTFNPRGEKIGEKVISIREFSPFYTLNRTTVGFDGSDNFYVGGWLNDEPTIAKLSLSSLSIDTSYGVNGYATIPRLSTGFDQLAFVGFGARPQVNRDGSVDVIAVKFGDHDSQTNMTSVVVTTVRFTSNGLLDTSQPEMVVTFPWFACNCPADSLALDIADAVVVDPSGGMIVPMSGLSYLDENGVVVPNLAPTAFSASEDGVTFQQTRTMCVCFRDPTTDGPIGTADGRVVRFLRNGATDASFGVNGVGGAPLLELGMDVALNQPRISLSPEGNIFLVATGIEAKLGDGGDDFRDIRLEGEYAYAVMLDPKGLPINFTPRKPSGIGSALGDVLRESRGEVGSDLPTTSPNLAEGAPAAVAAPPGVAASALVPSGVAQTTTAAAPVITVIGTPADRAIDVQWSTPESIAKGKATYTVTASPGGQKCSTATTSCVFKKLDPWTAYTFTITTVAAASTDVPASTPSIAVKPVRVLKRDTRTEPTKLITPASTGKQAWKATGGCKVSKDGKTFTTPKDAALCTLSLTTAKAGKVPKTTRTITVVVRAVAK